MRKGMILAVAVLAALLASPALAAREWGEGYGRGPGAARDVASVPGLNLTAEQTEKISVLREAHLREIRPLLGELFGKGKGLREMWLAKTPDRERIMALQREVHDLRGRLLEAFAAYRLEVRQMLTLEQQEKLRAFDAEWQMRHREAPRMGRGPHHGPGEAGPPPAGDSRGGKGAPKAVAP
jgi:Spy/CpxP family protein refolding chaperone